MQMILSDHFDFVFTDLRMPEITGMDLVRIVKQESIETEIAVMTAYPSIALAVEAVKAGACHFISKPSYPEEFISIVERTLSNRNKNLNNNIKGKMLKLSHANYFEECESEIAKQLLRDIKLVASTNLSVLIVGESGTGKEFIARLIHQNSKRSNCPFVAVDCGAIPKKILGSEFFGHEKGAFTGAIYDKKGYFEEAKGGVLFLDEIGNLPLENQTQLLRVLQERKLTPVGSSKTIDVDVRIITATNENLRSARKHGTFREDLYHRLNEFQIKVPPLRERKADILIFARYFLKLANQELGKFVQGFDQSVEFVFKQYDWPGNLREMKNIVKRAALLARGKQIELKDLPSELYENKRFVERMKSSFSNNDSEMIQKVLSVTNNNKSKTAKLLHIDRKTLYKRLRKYEILVPAKE